MAVYYTLDYHPRYVPREFLSSELDELHKNNGRKLTQEDKLPTFIQLLYDKPPFFPDNYVLAHTDVPDSDITFKILCMSEFSTPRLIEALPSKKFLEDYANGKPLIMFNVIPRHSVSGLDTWIGAVNSARVYVNESNIDITKFLLIHFNYLNDKKQVGYRLNYEGIGKEAINDWFKMIQQLSSRSIPAITPQLSSSQRQEISSSFVPAIKPQLSSSQRQEISSSFVPAIKPQLSSSQRQEISSRSIPAIKPQLSSSQRQEISSSFVPAIKPQLSSSQGQEISSSFVPVQPQQKQMLTKDQKQQFMGIINILKMQSQNASSASASQIDPCIELISLFNELLLISGEKFCSTCKIIHVSNTRCPKCGLYNKYLKYKQKYLSQKKY